jgi:hypothetical protein
MLNPYEHDFDQNSINRKKQAQTITIPNSINVNLDDYTLDDILNLLDVNIHRTNDIEEIQNEIRDKINHQILTFKKLKNDEIVEFFEKIKSSFLEEELVDSMTESEKLLQIFKDSIDVEPSKNTNISGKGTDTADKSLFNSNGGAGNKINRRTVTKLLTIDSRFRSNQDELSTDFSIDLNYHIKNAIEMKLSDIEFPTTYYPIDDDYENNYFWLRYKVSGIDQFAYIYIPEGNYYSENLITDLNDAMDEISIPVSVTFYLDYNNTGGVGNGNGKVVFELSSTSDQYTDFELNFNGSRIDTNDPDLSYSETQIINNSVSTTDKLNEILDKYYYTESSIPLRQRFGWMLGFRYGAYSGADQYQTEGVLDIIGPKYLYLVVNDLNNASNVNFFSSSPEGLLDDDILARISLKGYAFSIQSQSDFSVYTEPRYYYGPVDISKLKIKLVDEFGRTINLNGNDMSFTLSFITVYSQTT